MLLMQGARVGSLVRELRSRKACGTAKKKKEREREKIKVGTGYDQTEQKALKHMRRCSISSPNKKNAN